ncbi:fatty acyl-AMP ligase [Amycolatopsis cihanbeyliensis]|uniref:Long chain fatty acid CoA FadD26/fatty acid CoA ligase FadD32 n=1 Tax=Amycolatopsis cihanbeyliensis TaxID=1128664 RepID=A0A542DCY8_AMYCI|nr:fatty acyl-AMP ligase [Amycolatopsis cihanbeyliensis]TQJ00941.1 long chain fatty acid CoA FadD26/fatty acid CoA ligase FadD32 [Amycolatopsis cihanbeyliensis]
MTSSTDPAPPTQDTLVDWVSHWASVRPTAPAFSYVDYARHRDGLADTVRWSELDQLTKALAVRLREAGARPEDRAAILTPQGNVYVLAFLGCLAAGVVAVPLLGPDVPGQGGRLATVLGECDPEFILTTGDVLPVVRRFIEQHSGARARKLIAVDDLDLGAATRYQPPDPRGADVAYLQFTSGSTGQPSGAMITHANLAANVRQAVHAYGGDAEVTAVNWLPLFHDMGLAATVGVPMVLGVRSVYMSPLAFLQRPARWLWLLSRFSRCYGAAPNVAFEHCARIPRRERTGLDLRGVRRLLNGGEPIRADTVERFLDEFAPHGLRPTAVRPVYGLAEATVLVTTSDRLRIRAFDADALGIATAREAGPGAPRGRRLVSAGRPVEQLVRIVEPEWCTELDDGWVGEIWLHGPNIAAGYWGRPEREAAGFGARLESPSQGTPRQPWLRTGDLGFLHGGELYVTGRIEELIVVAGLDHYPQDIEHTVQRVCPVLRRDRLAAFGLTDEETETERVVVLAEVTPQDLPRPAGRGDLALAVRRALLAEHGLRLHDLVYLRPGSIPRTSSGKIQRPRCRARYQAGDLPTVVHTP